MPLATPQIKVYIRRGHCSSPPSSHPSYQSMHTQVNAVRRFGGPTVTVKLHGKNYDEASEEALRLAREEGLTMVHPFDDPEVIAGQGR